MEYFIIGDEDAVLGFRMVGVRGRTAVTREQAEAAFHEALAERGIGIIIITERTAELIRNMVDQYLFREKFPLIVEIHDHAGPLEDRADIRRLVNEAIGIKL